MIPQVSALVKDLRGIIADTAGITRRMLVPSGESGEAFRGSVARRGYDPAAGV
ncbi:hypothetical protein GCM10023198_40290 [Promicromonospora umidemergens]|uniref:Uncharacterized protein n=1 Tax=Promicromonospora umidemergens TaxID=629679 RepID=A0ABP8XRB1_9MICO